MAKKDLIIKSAYLATKENLPKKSIRVGKILNDYDADNFIFYIIEVNCDAPVCEKIRNTIIEKIESNSKNNHLFDQDLLESILSDINSALEKITQSGHNAWIGNLNATIGLTDKNVLSLASTGKLAGYLFRKGRISSLTDDIESSHLPHKTFVDLTSGPLSKDDKIVFANISLFDYYSIDQIRRLTTNKNIKTFTEEIFHGLKHRKVEDINLIALETEEDNPDDNSIDDDSAFFYLDEKEETAFDQFKKKALPVLQDIFKKIKKFLKDSKKYISKNAATLSTNTKRLWNEKIRPKTKEFMDKSVPAAGKAIKNAQNKLTPALKSIKENKSLQSLSVKTRSYSNASESKIVQTAQTTLSFLKNILISAKKKENRKYLYIILIVILLWIGYAKIKSNNAARDQKNKVAQVENSYSEAETAFANAKNDLSLGKSGAQDELSAALELARTASSSSANADKAKKLIRDIESSLDKLSITTRFYDSSPIIKIGSKIVKTVLVGTDIYAINSDGKIYNASVNSNEASLTASIGKDNGSVEDLTYSDADQKIFMLTDKQKVISYDIKSKTNELVSMDGSKDWEKANSIASFASSLYLLSGESGTITKHTPADTGFNKATPYSDSKKVDLKNSINIVIDGNIFVLLNNGKVAKFSKGAYDSDFSLKNIPSPDSTIKNPDEIYTSSDNNSIYVLDKALNRIIKFDKSGEFTKQYIPDGVNINDFIVNDKLQKMWISSDENIYQFDL